MIISTMRPDNCGTSHQPAPHKKKSKIAFGMCCAYWVYNSFAL